MLFPKVHSRIVELVAYHLAKSSVSPQHDGKWWLNILTGDLAALTIAEATELGRISNSPASYWLDLQHSEEIAVKSKSPTSSSPLVSSPGSSEPSKLAESSELVE
jgi:hypothetical protein